MWGECTYINSGYIDMTSLTVINPNQVVEYIAFMIISVYVLLTLQRTNPLHISSRVSSTAPFILVIFFHLMLFRHGGRARDREPDTVRTGST